MLFAFQFASPHPKDQLHHAAQWGAVRYQNVGTLTAVLHLKTCSNGNGESALSVQIVAD